MMTAKLFSTQARQRAAQQGLSRIMSKKDFELVFEELLRKSCQQFNHHGHLEPTLYMPMLNSEGQILQIGFMPSGPFLSDSEFGPNEFQGVVEQLLAHPDSDFCVFVAESTTLSSHFMNKDVFELPLTDSNSSSFSSQSSDPPVLLILMYSKHREAFARIPLTMGRAYPFSTSQELLVFVNPITPFCAALYAKK